MMKWLTKLILLFERNKIEGVHKKIPDTSTFFVTQDQQID